MTWTGGHVAARTLAAVGLASFAIALAGAPVSARVTVDPPRAASGGYTTLAFSVSTERTDASTTEVEIRFPDDHPMPALTTEPKPGWDVTVDEVPATTATPPPDGAADDPTAEPVAGVTWTASTTDAAIAPGTFELFRVSVGPLPSGVDLLLFEARQTFSDGEVISWDGEPTEGSDDPASARPAPTLTLMGQVPTDMAVSQADSAEPTRQETTLVADEVSATIEDDDDRSARVALGFAAGGVLIFGAVAATAFARRRDGDAPKLPGA